MHIFVYEVLYDILYSLYLKTYISLPVNYIGQHPHLSLIGCQDEGKIFQLRRILLRVHVIDYYYNGLILPLYSCN